MDKFRTLVLLAAFCLFSHVAGAADAGNLIDGKFESNSKKDRTAIARDLLAEVSGFADLLPLPRPSDTSWVETERAAIDRLGNSAAASSRLLQFYESPEFQNVKLANTLDQIKSAIECILNQGIPLRREVYCWATASFFLGDKSTFADGIAILRRAKRLPKDARLKGKIGDLDGVAVSFEFFSRGIQQYIVLPYLKAEIN